MQIYIDGWKSHIIFSSAHFIPDYTKCGRLHGHSYAINAVLEGEIGEKGILFDFSEVKDALREIAREMDHKVILPAKGIEILERENEVEIHFEGKRYVFPSEECFFLPYPASSAEYLAQYILDSLLKKIEMPSNVILIKIGVDEGPGQSAWVEKRIR
ncbi:MAG: 6-pyruvoyl tetrahydropterin synthase family protein [Chloroflexota bacterium]|nr:MAG: 6-pyruvoyl tetrahydropterin synthase family protein [Chloroflexota bacterium]RLF44307.1 MAG: 6-pyruvoyl tetrahydropterin synthase family protein [Thermoplasmata archaeon]